MRSISYVLAIIVVATFGAFAYYAWSLFTEASPNVKLGLLAAAVSVVTFIYNNYRQQQREINSRHFVEKRQTYQKFFDLLFDILRRQDADDPIDQDEIVEKMRDTVKDVMVWGSANTINEYNKFIRTTASQPEGLAIFPVVETLLRALRKDLGHNDQKMEKFGLTKLIVKGDEHGALDAL